MHIAESFVICRIKNMRYLLMMDNYYDSKF